jgi:tetratricopeptide (TPR) repeat protein
VLANDYADADKWMTRAVSWQPTDPELWYSLGRIKNTENRFAEGRDCFEHTLALSPKLVKAENNLGLSYEGLNQPEQARAAYQAAIDWQKGSAAPSEQPLLNLGKLELDSNQPAGALPLLLEAETIAPDNVDVHAALGRLYTRQGDVAKAQRELEEAVRLAPDNSAYHFQLGQAYRKAGLTTKASTEFAAAQRLDGQHSTH